MNILFEPLYSVNLSHEYFSSGQSVDDYFSIIPTRQCQAVIQQQGLVFRQTGAGLSIFYEYKETQIGGAIRHVPIKPFPEQCQMSFMLVPKLQHFFNKTHIRINEKKPGVFRLGNLNSNKIGPNLYINGQTGSQTVTGQDRKLIRTKRFKEKSLSAAQLVDFTIVNEFSPHPIIRLKEKVMRDKTFDPQGTASAFIDLSGFDDGIYSVTKESETTSFYASDEITKHSAFAVIDIYIQPQVPVEYQLMHPDGYATPKTYHLKFAARHVWWKFIIIAQNRADVLASQLSITSLDSTINFGDAIEGSLEDGTTCFSFVSNKKIPLNKKTLKGFGFTKSGSQPFSLENLANPDSGRLVPHESITDEYYAESYIYI